MNDEQRLLLAEAPPSTQPVDPGTPEGWSAVEQKLGTSLPDDYKWLINTYGSGDFCDLLAIVNPFAATEAWNLLSQVSPVLNHYRFGGPFNHTFPCFPEEGGLLPVGSDTSGGDLFWLTRGRPCDWQLVLFDYDDTEQYSMGLVKFLGEWISGRMPRSFFGTGNSPGIIRRDPVFCPAGQVRSALSQVKATESLVSPSGPSPSGSEFVAAETRKASDDTIASLNAQGCFACAMDSFAPGAMFVATSAGTDETGAKRSQGSLVAVYPKGSVWIVAPVPAMGVGPLFVPLSFQTLDEAVTAAKALVHPDANDPREQAVNRRAFPQ
jgi:hypothetical protein